MQSGVILIKFSENFRGGGDTGRWGGGGEIPGHPPK